MVTLKSIKRFPQGQRFPLGQVVITDGAINELSADEVRECLLRHAEGDWGDLSPEDWELNDEALENEGRLLSRYVSQNGQPFWIITEWDRSVTTILLPEEY